MKAAGYSLRHLFLFICCLFGDSSLNGQPPINLKTEIETKYHITIESTEPRADTWRKVTSEPVTEEELNNYLGLLRKALMKYPADFFATIGLQFLHIGKDLKFDNVNRSAVPDNYSKVLFLSIKTATMDYDDYYLIHCFHHELNHYTEFSIWGSYRYSWTPWMPLFNPDNAKGGEYAYSNSSENWYRFDSTLTGFSNKYSTLGQEEDRSEIIAFFLTDDNHEHQDVLNKAQADKVYSAKCDTLFKYYAERLKFGLPAEVWMHERTSR